MAKRRSSRPRTSPSRSSRSGGSKRGRWSSRPLWALLGLSALGAAAVVLSSRRIRPLDDWSGLLDEAPDSKRLLRFPSVTVPVEGPQGILAVADGGHGGIPVVFVHGLGGAADQWQGQLEAARGSRRAVAVELRGHGRSDPADDGVYGIEEYADDVMAVVDDLGFERFALVGHSLGALVTIEVAARHPERVDRLLLVDPNGDQSGLPREEVEGFLEVFADRPAEELRFHFQQVLAGAAEGVKERVLADLDNLDEAAIAQSLGAAGIYPASARLSAYEGPRQLLITELNQLPISLHRLLPELPVKLIAGTSHWAMMDDPDSVNDVLRLFLS
ncbi:MAG: alpha/beta fold hydrolase [Acidobacteriota bacterium]